MQTPEVFVVRDPDLLLEAVAARLVTHLVDHIYARSWAVILLQNDPVVSQLFGVLANSPLGRAVDWEHVTVWWANSNSAGSSRTEEAHGYAALRSLGVPPADLHSIDSDPRAAPGDVAVTYSQQLRAARQLDDHGEVPAFDIALLVIGHDGGVAGLLPERPSAHFSGAVAVDSVTRTVTLTGSAISTSREVWLIGTGMTAAPGVHLALTGGPLQVPAAGARGQSRTLLLLDEPAASALPSSLRRLASP